MVSPKQAATQRPRTRSWPFGHEGCDAAAVLVAHLALVAGRHALAVDEGLARRAAAAAIGPAHQVLAAQRQAGAVEALGALRAAGRHAAAVLVTQLAGAAQRHALSLVLLLALAAAVVGRRQAIARLRVARVALLAGRHALAAEGFASRRAAVVRRHAAAVVIARVALVAGRHALAAQIVIARRAFRRRALAAQVGVGARRALRRHAIAIGVALGSLFAGRHAAAMPVVEAIRALRRRRYAARRVIEVAQGSRRAAGQADPLIAGRPVAGWQALPGLGIAPISGGAGILVVAAAQTLAVAVGAVRTIGHALQRVGREHHAGRAVVLRPVIVRHAVVGALQVAVIAIRALRQRHLLISVRAAVFAGRRAEAGVARVTQPSIRAGRQAEIIIGLLAFRAARRGWCRTAAACGATAKVCWRRADVVGKGARRAWNQRHRQPQQGGEQEAVQRRRIVIRHVHAQSPWLSPSTSLPFPDVTLAERDRPSTRCRKLRQVPVRTPADRRHEAFSVPSIEPSRRAVRNSSCADQSARGLPADALIHCHRAA